MGASTVQVPALGSTSPALVNPPRIEPGTRRAIGKHFCGSGGLGRRQGFEPGTTSWRAIGNKCVSKADLVGVENIMIIIFLIDFTETTGSIIALARGHFDNLIVLICQHIAPTSNETSTTRSVTRSTPRPRRTSSESKSTFSTSLELPVAYFLQQRSKASQPVNCHRFHRPYGHWVVSGTANTHSAV